jgi:hypothetical protein
MAYHVRGVVEAHAHHVGGAAPGLIDDHGADEPVDGINMRTG